MWHCFVCMSFSHAGDKLPPDERAVVDPELAELQREWLQAREHHLGHLSAFSFDLSSAPPGVPSQKKTAGRSTQARMNLYLEYLRSSQQSGRVICFDL